MSKLINLAGLGAERGAERGAALLQRVLDAQGYIVMGHLSSDLTIGRTMTGINGHPDYRFPLVVVGRSTWEEADRQSATFNLPKIPTPYFYRVVAE